ncbi:MAG: hypothetical protein F4X94_09540 [Dehalococcoidia bacterium]|nr:hypothetical protein [Dehalococcoidia bacterium]
MDQQEVTKALSNAIVEEAQREFERLSAGMGTRDIAYSVENALRELRRLSSSEMPQYDDRWVALFYLTWYQPRQINTVYRMLRGYLIREDIVGSELLIVDFGCGALATQFGVALAFADLAQLRKPIPRINILLMDSSCIL